MSIVDIVIPVASYHEEVVRDAIESAAAQTVSVNVIVEPDNSGAGAASTRNKGAERGNAPFLLFLDADDILLPEFAEKCLRRYVETAKPGYVYTDWFRGEKIAHAEETWNIFTAGMYHLNTTLLPRAFFEGVGGYRTIFPVLEDEDLYKRIQCFGICAYRVPEPLIRYRADKGQSGLLDKHRHDDLIFPVVEFWKPRDKQLARIQAMCCGNPEPPIVTPQGVQLEGDILAVPLYTPRKMKSPTTNRIYDRPMMGVPMYVNRNDVAARPDLWQTIVNAEEIAPDVETVKRLAGF